MSALRRAWAAWKRIAHAIGDVQARIILGVIYFVFLGPCALAVRLSGPDAGAGWRPLPEPPGSPRDGALRQY